MQDRRKQANPNGFYGPWILALDARSSAYQEFLGGPGTIAIHGAGAGNPLGIAISHGCIRVSPALDAWLGPRLVPGTPVAIDVPSDLAVSAVARARHRGRRARRPRARHGRALGQHEPAEHDRDRHDQVGRRAEPPASVRASANDQVVNAMAVGKMPR